MINNESHQPITACYSYPNTGGAPGLVLVYRHICGRSHFTRLAPNDLLALTFPPCADDDAPVLVRAPRLQDQLPAAPLDLWQRDFEAERKRARGGRPAKTTEAVGHVSKT